MYLLELPGSSKFASVDIGFGDAVSDFAITVIGFPMRLPISKFKKIVLPGH